MTIRFELTPKTSRQKSYYRKAFVIIENGVRALQSYETRVASFDPFEEVFTVFFSAGSPRIHSREECDLK